MPLLDGALSMRRIKLTPLNSGQEFGGSVVLFEGEGPTDGIEPSLVSNSWLELRDTRFRPIQALLSATDDGGVPSERVPVGDYDVRYRAGGFVHPPSGSSASQYMWAMRARNFEFHSARTVRFS